MKKRLRIRRPSPAMVVALIALCAGITGGAYAAATIDGGDIVNGSIGKKDLKKNAVVSKKVKNGSLKPQDFGGQLPAGPKGDKGDKGEPGADLTQNSVLPSQETQTGVWGAAAGNGNYGMAVFNFRQRLPEDLPLANVHALNPGATSPDCPGVGQAAPGHLCAYTTFMSGASLNNMWNPVDSPPVQGADRTGGIMYISGSAALGNAWGSWAVTAP